MGGAVKFYPYTRAGQKKIKSVSTQALEVLAILKRLKPYVFTYFIISS